MDRFTVAGNGEAILQDSILFSGSVPGSDRWPAESLRLRNDGIIEWVTVSAVRNSNEDAVESRAAYPEAVLDAEPRQVVRDYRRPAAAQRDAAPGTELLVFSLGEPATRVPPARPDAPVQDTPAPSANEAADPNAAEHTELSNDRRMPVTIAVALGAGAVVAIALFRKTWRR